MATITLQKSTSDSVIRFCRRLNIELHMAGGKTETEATAICLKYHSHPILEYSNSVFSFKTIGDVVVLDINEDIVSDLLDSVFDTVRIGFRVYHALAGLGIFSELQAVGAKFMKAVRQLAD